MTAPLRRCLLPLVLIALGVVLAPIATASAAETAPYIVLFKTSSDAATRAATADIVEEENVRTTQRYDDAVHGFAARLDHHDLDAIRDDPRVADVVRDLPVKATGLVPVTPGDNIPTGVRRVGAAVGNTVREASSVNVAVIDTGIDLTHPDLNAVAGTSCNGSGTPTDGNGHGTHVAGTIAARNDGSGAVGVAPGSKLWAVRVLDANGSGLTSGVICGIDWATSTRTDSNPDNDIVVANMSLGGSAYPNDNCGRTVGDPLHIAICNSVAAGVTYVVAAGNSGADEQNFSPASFPEVLTVTSVSDADGLPGGSGGSLNCINNADDTAASYSNFATRAVDIAHTVAAPGSCIRSTYPGNRYATMSGTSMAAPHVAGLVALCEGEAGGHGPCWGKTPAQVGAIIRQAAADQAAADPASVFGGSPARPIAGRYYGDLAGTRFPGTTTPAPVIAPANTRRPAVSGAATTVGTLAAAPGTWTGTAPITYATQWLRCTSTSEKTCLAIPGADAATYNPTMADVGRRLRARVTASNSKATVSATSDATGAVKVPPPVAPANTGRPVISGAAVIGGALAVTPGTWTGTAPITISQQWVRCTTLATRTCADIPGARGGAYTPVTADTGRLLRVRTVAGNVKRAITLLSDPTAAVPAAAPAATVGPPVAVSEPTITGLVTAGSALTAKAGTMKGSQPMTYTFYWAACAPGSNTCYYNNIVAPTMTVPSAPAGTRYVVVMMAENGYGRAYVQSAPTGGLAGASITKPTIAGLPAGVVVI